MILNLNKEFSLSLIKRIQSDLQNAEHLDLQKLETLASDSYHFWEIANILGNYYNDFPVNDAIKQNCIQLINDIRNFQGKLAKLSQEPTLVVFGTSGWRGVIGEDFTLLNVHKVVRGIIEMMKTNEFLRVNGFRSFEEVRQKGILLLRDNRYMGDAFLDAAMKELAAEEIKIYFAGECPTGVGSALVTELGAAGSLNFTPSHNPMEYAGLKFNPADGGPADTNLTAIIEEKANYFMNEGQSFSAATADYMPLKNDIHAAQVFREFIEKKSKVFDLASIRSWLKSQQTNLKIIVDNMHGSSRGYIEALLGEELVSQLKSAGALTFVHINEDFSFHGVKPEPSAKNQKPLIKALQKASKKYTLAVALDPDADRIRYCDAEMDIDMNRFGAIAFGMLAQKGLPGGVASTAPSSDFALNIARENKRPVFETAVGFKHFRAPLQTGKVLVAFEESDGISFLGHTLEKCAMAGFLAALEVMTFTEKNLSSVYRELQKQYGYFYPDKAGADVKGVSIEAWQQYKKAVLQVLQNDLFKKSDTIVVDGAEKEITDINTIDGLKVIFRDKSWILLRPSGTEPKFRYYYEVASATPLPDAEQKLAAYRQAAEMILSKARTIVDNR